MGTVFLSGSIDAAAREKLAASVRLVEGRKDMGAEAFYAAVAEVDVILSKDDPAPLDGTLFARAPRLKYISRHGTACPGLDLEAARQRGLLVSNTGGVNAVSVAECALALMFHLARNLGTALGPDGLNAPRSRLMGMELHGKTLGVVGVGNVGREVVVRARALGMRVLACQPPASAGRAEAAGVPLADQRALAELVAVCDLVSLHAPLNGDTQGLVGADIFARAKPGLLLINAARPGLVDEAALVAALESGRIGGYALDAVPGPASPLRGRADVLLTPHVGTLTHDCSRRVGLAAVDNILRFFAGETPHYLL